MSQPTLSAFFSPTNPPARNGRRLVYPQSAPNGLAGLDFSYDYANDAGARVITGATTLADTDAGLLIVCNSSSPFTVNLPAAIPFNDVNGTWSVRLFNLGAGTVTVNRNGLLLNNATVNPTLTTGSAARVDTDGTNWWYVSPASSSLTGGVNAQTGTSYTIATSDYAKLVTFNNSSAVAVTLPQATGSFTSPFWFAAKNLGAGVVTITPTTSTIGGASTLVLRQNQWAFIYSDGTNYQEVAIFDDVNMMAAALQCNVNGGGAVPQTGSQGVAIAPYDGRFTGWQIVGNVSGSIQFDIKSASYASYPSTASIVASAPPVMTSASKAQSSTLTGWTTAFSKGDNFDVSITSVSTLFRATLILFGTRN